VALSAKTQFLNAFRSVFKLPFLERWLARRTVGKAPEHFWCKLLPNPYQYPAPSWRRVTRDGVALQVDITDFMGYVYYFGIKSESYDRLFGLCQPGHCVIDVGANIGWTLLNLARLSGTGRVVGFEPDPFNRDQCTNNIALNGASNITLLPYGLGETPQRMRMDPATPANRGGRRIAPGQVGDGTVVEIRTLDDIDVIAQLSKVNLVKIDVEGYELKVLKGARQLLRRHQPVLFVEIDDKNLREQGDSASSLVAFLLETGYRSIVHAGTGAPLSPADDYANRHFDLIARSS
jgi:FkbM family methyltransferase